MSNEEKLDFSFGEGLNICVKIVAIFCLINTTLSMRLIIIIIILL